MLTLGEKIKLSRLEKGLKQSDVAERLGVKNTTISNWEKNVSKPDADYIGDLCGILEINPNYLFEYAAVETYITSEEKEHIRKYRLLKPHEKEMIDTILTIAYREYENSENEKANKIKETSISYTCDPESRVYPEGVVPIDSYQTEDDEDDTRISMPVYDLGASAGTGVFLDNPCYEMVSMPEDRLSRKANFALWVSGNSMEPRFHNGDLVLVKIQPSVEVGEIGIFILNGEGYIKKWGGDKLISLNREYDPIEIGENDTLYCKGKVIGNA